MLEIAVLYGNKTTDGIKKTNLNTREKTGL